MSPAEGPKQLKHMVKLQHEQLAVMNKGFETLANILISDQAFKVNNVKQVESSDWKVEILKLTTRLNKQENEIHELKEQIHKYKMNYHSNKHKKYI